MIDENLDKWWALAKDDPQRSVREATQSRLQLYFSGWKRDPEATLKLAELMIFHPMGRERQENRVASLCKTAVDFRVNQEALQHYVAGMTELLDRLESEMGEEGFELAKHRKNLNRYNDR